MHLDMYKILLNLLFCFITWSWYFLLKDLVSHEMDRCWEENDMVIILQNIGLTTIMFVTWNGCRSLYGCMRSSTDRLFDGLCLLVSFYGCSSIFLFCSFTCNWANWHGRYRGLDPWDVYSSGPSWFYYDWDDWLRWFDTCFLLVKRILKLVATTSYAPLGWMGTRINGLTLEIEVKQMSL